MRRPTQRLHRLADAVRGEPCRLCGDPLADMTTFARFEPAVGRALGGDGVRPHWIAAPTCRRCADLDDRVELVESTIVRAALARLEGRPAPPLPLTPAEPPLRGYGAGPWRKCLHCGEPATRAMATIFHGADARGLGAPRGRFKAVVVGECNRCQPMPDWIGRVYGALCGRINRLAEDRRALVALAAEGDDHSIVGIPPAAKPHESLDGRGRPRPVVRPVAGQGQGVPDVPVPGVECDGPLGKGHGLADPFGAPARRDDKQLRQAVARGGLVLVAESPESRGERWAAR